MIRKPALFFLAALFTLALANATGMCQAAVTADDVIGRYTLAVFFHDLAGSTSESRTAGGYADFTESSGTYEYSVILEAASDGNTGTASGSYSIDTQGRLLIDGNVSHAALSRDAGIVFIPDLDPAEGDDLGLRFMAGQNPGLTISDLHGRYNFVEFYHDAAVADSGNETGVSAGHLMLDPENRRVRWQEEANSRNQGLESGTQTYGVSNGRLTINGGSAHAPVDRAGSIIVVPDTDAADAQDVGMRLAVKAATNLTASDLFGRYQMVGFYHRAPSGGDNELDTFTGYVNFDGAGQWRSQTKRSGLEGRVSETDGGQYSIGENGRLRINGEPTYGAISPDGGFIILPELDPDDGGDVGIRFLIRAPLPAANITSATATINTSISTAVTDGTWQRSYQGIPDNFAPMTDIANFSAAISTNLVEFTFDVTGLFGIPADLLLMKLKTAEPSLQFFYAESFETDQANYVDGTMWLTDPKAANSYVNPLLTALNPEKTYTVHFVIGDGGDYDLNPTDGEIVDPLILGAGIQYTSDDTGSGGAGESSGCFINSVGLRKPNIP